MAETRPRSRSPRAKPVGAKSPCSFRYAIFDLDGTLIDFEGASHIGLANALHGAGLKPEAMTWELHASIIGMPQPAWSQKLLDALQVPRDKLTPENYGLEYDKILPSLHADIKAMDGAVGLLHRLKALGVRIAIATSSRRKEFDAKMKFHPDILNAVDVVVCGDDTAVKKGKPAPDIFLVAASRLGAPPSECVVFEDSPHGIRAGHDASMYTVAIPDARLPGNDFSLADRTLSSLEEWLAELPPKHIKVYYGDMPFWRAECIRMALFIGDVKFEDCRTKKRDELNAEGKLPFGATPVLEVDGKILSQTQAMASYVSSLAGMRPADAWGQAKVDEAINGCTDCTMTVGRTFSLPADEKILERQKLIAPGGRLYMHLSGIDRLVRENGSTGFIVGRSLTVADLALWRMIGWISGGVIDGIPKDFVSTTFPGIGDVCASVERNAKVQAWKELHSKFYIAA